MRSAVAESDRNERILSGLFSPSRYPSSSAILMPTTPGRFASVDTIATPCANWSLPASHRLTRSVSSQIRMPWAFTASTARSYGVTGGPSATLLAVGVAWTPGRAGWVPAVATIAVAATTAAAPAITNGSFLMLFSPGLFAGRRWRR